MTLDSPLVFYYNSVLVSGEDSNNNSRREKEEENRLAAGVSNDIAGDNQKINSLTGTNRIL